MCINAPKSAEISHAAGALSQTTLGSLRVKHSAAQAAPATVGTVVHKSVKDFKDAIWLIGFIGHPLEARGLCSAQ